MSEQRLANRVALVTDADAGTGDESAFLASDDASYVNGQTIAVDGGIVCT